MRHGLDVEHTAGVAALLGLTANPESPVSVAVSRPSDVLVARVAVAQTATALLLEASGLRRRTWSPTRLRGRLVARDGLAQHEGVTPATQVRRQIVVHISKGALARVLCLSLTQDEVFSSVLLLPRTAVPRRPGPSQPGTGTPRFATNQPAEDNPG